MAKNTANGKNGIEGIDESQFSQEENLGFPPYWNPSDGAKFIATVVHLDDGDPDFERWVFQASHDIVCHRGPKTDDKPAEEIQVKKGEFFSTSNYAQFKLNQYVGLEVMLYVKGKRKLEGGHTMWDMGMKVSEKTKALLNEKRQRAVSGILPQSATQTQS